MCLAENWKNTVMDNEKTINANGIKIWCETFGNSHHPALLLIMGNSCDAFMWPLDFCQQLAASGWYVIRFDQRDTGLSSHIDFEQSPYSLNNMADDALALLNNLTIEKAHVLGYSTGGAIAMHFAHQYPNRVISLILMMTSLNLHIKNDAFQGKDISHAMLSPPKGEYITNIKTVMQKKTNTPQEKIQQYVNLFKLSNGSQLAFDEAYFYTLFEKSQNRRLSPSHKKIGYESNHALATSVTPILSEEQLQGIFLPILIIAGGEDPIFQIDHAHKMAHTFPNAVLYIIKELGHVLNPLCFDEIISTLVMHTKKLRNLT